MSLTPVNNSLADLFDVTAMAIDAPIPMNDIITPSYFENRHLPCKFAIVMNKPIRRTIVNVHIKAVDVFLEFFFAILINRKK